MNIEEYRDYCLSLGADVEEKLPFTALPSANPLSLGKLRTSSLCPRLPAAFHYASGVLVFYVCGHMFSFFDCDNYGLITLKCQPERIEELKVEHSCIGKPFNMSSKHWIGIDAATAPDDLLRELTRNSYEIVKEKYMKKYHCYTENGHFFK